MSYEVLKDFEFHSKVPDEVIEKYQGLVPDELIEIWKEYGFGSFWNGYLKVINPNDYRDILDESYLEAKVSIPIFTTAFGDIITWEDNEYAALLKYRNGEFKNLTAGFENFFPWLAEKPKFWISRFDNDLYDKAVSKYGLCQYDECFGYTPLLVLGGAEKIENLQKVEIIPHIELITQAAGRILEE